MKRVVFALILMAILAISAIAQDEYEELPQNVVVPDTVQNSLSIEFHAVSGDDRVTLNLPDYFGRKADFVAAPSEHVNVQIDANGVATLSSKDPAWRGIEEVIFAVSKEYLVEKKEEVKRPYTLRNLSAITSKDKIALISDAFTQEQYDTIVGSLSAEQVVIASTLTDDALELDLNKEITLSFSNDEKSILPKVQMDFHAKDENITLASYSEPSDTMFLALLIIGVGTILILGFYLKYMFTGPLKTAMFAPKKKITATSRASQYKGDTASKLKDIRRRLGKENPAKLYKETLMAMNSFITKSFRVSGANIEQADKKLDNYGITGSLKSDIISYITEYREAAYKASEIKKEDAEKLIRFAESILNRL
ncbi:MAG: hypothetical protein PHO02_01610 [Candidatus Nanoarchaeia archaeon]|nr:hypothetical protein [Candidatus Nanoarchaeia archaeon]